VADYDKAPANPRPSARVKTMCGQISDMTLWRWVRDLAFPAPDLVIQRRKFRRRATGDEMAGRSQAAAEGTGSPPRRVAAWSF
jgi:hypothetical protein